MQLVVTNSDMMKLIGGGSAYVFWQSMSNELGTPKVLHCPEDTKHLAATNFPAGFSNANISYFFNLDGNEIDPRIILTGDDHLAVNDIRVQPGILNLSTNDSVTWTKERHKGSGNICLDDGSVQSITSSGLRSTLADSAITNRLVIP